jgi:hypothetical protein
MGEDAHPEILVRAEYVDEHMNAPTVRIIG